jgi:hypothetical protein
MTEPLSGASADAVAAMAHTGRRIQWLILLYLCSVIIGLVATTLWPQLLAYQPALVGHPIDLGALDWQGRVTALAALSIPTTPLISALWQALRLCRSLVARRLFTIDVPVRLRHIGIALLVSAALRPVGGMMTALAVSSFAGGGQHHLAVVFSTDDLGLAVVGAIVIAVAAAAREAVRLADENSRFV